MTTLEICVADVLVEAIFSPYTAMLLNFVQFKIWFSIKVTGPNLCTKVSMFGGGKVLISLRHQDRLHTSTKHG